MERTIIGFEPDQLDALRRVAEERGVSMASVVREAVAAHLERAEREAAWTRLLAAAGTFRVRPDPNAGSDEPGKEHDRWIAEAYEEHHGRRRR